MVKKILEAKIHGVAFSPLVEGQGPTSEVGEAQIRARLETIQPFVRWVRSFSCSRGNELIPRIARERGLDTLVGVWLNDERDYNEIELAHAIEVAKAGDASMVAVGNEVLLRGELSEDELITYIERMKQAVPGVPVGYVDAYFLFEDHPRVTELCDLVFANCYPFWEGYPIEHAHLYMKEMYRRAIAAGRGKKVVISETGWPNLGSAVKGALPSTESAMKYFIDACRWTEAEGIDLFYFAAYDETWKVAAEGDVGAYWGLWDKEGNPKYF